MKPCYKSGGFIAGAGKSKRNKMKWHPPPLRKSRDSGCCFSIEKRKASKETRDYSIKNLAMQESRYYNASRRLAHPNCREGFSDIWKEGAERLGMYESNISDARWIAYDLPGNMGWIAFLVTLGMCFIQKPEIVESKFISILLLLNLLCAAAMVVAIMELISERIQKLDRVLPKKRLYRGFGALTFGGLAGAVLSLLALAAALRMGLSGTVYLAVLCGGGLLCFVFGGLLFREYKKI